MQANDRISLLHHRNEQLLLISKVMVDQIDVAEGTIRDRAYACTVIALLRKLVRSGIKDTRLGGNGVPRRALF